MRDDARATLGERHRGRKPRIANTPSVERVEIRITAAERIDLEQVAAANHTTMTDVLREAVNEYVSDFRDRRLFVR
jgi:hypothetical protein